MTRWLLAIAGCLFSGAAAADPVITPLAIAIGNATFFSAGASILIAKAIVYSSVSMILNRAVNALTKKPTGKGRGIEANFYDSTASSRIVLGEVFAGGMNVIPGIVTGNKGQYLHQVVALAGHEVDSFSDVKFDQTTIASANIASVTGSDNDGLVTSGDYADHAWIRRYVGNQTQNVDFILNAADSTAFPASFRGRGIAYGAVRYKYKTKVYQGVPNVTFKFKGAKVYDPRLDSTNGGAGSHRYTDETTWAWSDNPALCTAWFLMNENLGGDYDPATDIDWALVSAAATVCDTNVNVPSTTEDRYTCNGILLAADEFVENLGRLVDTMLGRIVFRDGQWRMYAGSWTTPSFTINKEDWLEGGISVKFIGPRQGGRWNGVRCFYVDKDRQYQRVECYPRTNAGYMADDGAERIWLEIEQPLCDQEYEAQRKAEMLLRQSRNQIRVTGRLPPRFQNIATWDTCYVNFDDFGWDDKTFRVVTWDLNEDGSVTVTLAEEQSTDWTDMASGEYNTPSTQNLTGSLYKPNEPPAFSARAVADAVQFYVGQPDNYLPGVYYILREYTALTPVNSSTIVGTFAQTRYDHPRTDTTSKFYWVQAAYSDTQVSTYVPSSQGLLGRPLYVSSGFRFELNDNSLSKTSSASQFTVGVAIMTPVNGTAPYSAWYTLTSGNFAPPSQTSSQCTFTTSGLSNGDVRVGQATANMTDAVGATYSQAISLYAKRLTGPEP